MGRGQLYQLINNIKTNSRLVAAIVQSVMYKKISEGCCHVIFSFRSTFLNCSG